ncbi:MAG: MgtC/SapB family protein, partial [Phycisphaerales bacterium]|nr:MgtC/SapB family protein [Phycisphaerales bacterium]
MELHLTPPVAWWDMLLRLLTAMLLGALIGWDRERRRRPAGFRTHMTVALGACGFTIVGLMGVNVEGADSAPLDPLRVIAGIIGGVGFLGAGA